MQPRKKSWFADAIEAVREVVQGGAPTPSEQPISTSHVEADESEPASEPVARTTPEPAISTALVAPTREQRPEEISAAEKAEVWSQFVGSQSFETKSDAEVISLPAEGAPSHKDPALEMPAAAHVTPEPLLVPDEQPAQSPYEDHEEQTAPLQSFPFPDESEPVNGEPAADLVATSHGETAVLAGPTEASESEDRSAHHDFSERIPTAPPPNREALAGIPFLMPSPAVLEHVNSPQAPAPQANIDEVVQKVLERLEPQLHELLSKNLLKPLVENMLQNELAKKDR
jgi:hypothetical protein